MGEFMKKWLIILLMLPTLCFASKPNSPWEEIQGPSNEPLYRMSVPHGWIVHTRSSTFYGYSPTSIFVPDENHEWVLDVSN